MREQNTKRKVLGNILEEERERERERVVILICLWLVLKLEIAGSHDLTSFKIFFSQTFSPRAGKISQKSRWPKIIIF